MRLRAEAAAVISIVSPELGIGVPGIDAGIDERLALIGEFVHCHGNSQKSPRRNGGQVLRESRSRSSSYFERKWARTLSMRPNRIR